jgi:hypothetical protein
MYFNVERSKVNFRKQKVEKKTNKIFAPDKETAEAIVGHMNRKANSTKVFVKDAKTGKEELKTREVPQTYKLKGVHKG